MPFYNYGNEMLALDLLGTIYLFQEYNLNTYTPTPPPPPQPSSPRDLNHQDNPHSPFSPTFAGFSSTIHVYSAIRLSKCWSYFFINNSSIIDVHITVQ